MNKELLSNKNILYVEDETAAAEEVSFFLQHYMKNLYVAKDGQEGLEIFQTNSIDLVITDIQMPKVNGLEMAKIIRETDASIPIIIVSAFNESSMLLEAINLGIDAYLLKPLSLKKLLEKIEKLLHTKELEHELLDSKEKLKILKKLEDTEKELLLYKERVDFAFRATQEGLWDWDIKRGTVYLSSRWKEIIGYSDDELKNSIGVWENSLYSADLKRAKDEIEKVFSHLEEHYEIEFRQIHKDGHFIWILSRGTVEYDTCGQPVRMIGTHQDISKQKKIEFELKEAKKIAENLAITDGLTGLYNRRYFNEIIDKELKRSKRDSKNLALLMLDIDYFKQYNDTYGHKQGDKALASLAMVLQECASRAEDSVFRVGGEEFCILFFPKSIEEAENYANKIISKIKSIELEHKTSKVSKYLTVSIGIAFKRYDIDADKLYQRVDEALYSSKHNGRDQVNIYNCGGGGNSI
jgi:diguanylate cyclase (GGDEF)-like protein/PAS domain S-box-containing protein